MGNGKGRKPRPRRRLRAGGTRAKIFFGNLERGEKDGHFGAHERGDKRVLTERSGSREFEEQRGRDSPRRTRRARREEKQKSGVARRGKVERGQRG